MSEKDAEIVFNWFDDIDFSYVITTFLAMFLSWCFDQDNFLIKGILFTCMLFNNLVALIQIFICIDC